VQFEIILDKHVEGNWIPRISCLKIYTWKNLSRT
jgi:hypothetical protein